MVWVQAPPARAADAPGKVVGVSSPEPAGPEVNQVGVSRRGFVGLHRVESADGLLAGTWMLTAQNELARSSGLFANNDTNVFDRLVLGGVWSPNANLAIAFSYNVIINRNDRVAPAGIQAAGDPTLALKLSLPSLPRLPPDLSLAALVALTLPTSERGSGLAPSAFALDSLIIGSWQVSPGFALSGNLGYRRDNSAELFGRRLAPVERFAMGISDADALLLGLGGQTALALFESLSVAPFGELSAAVPLGADAGQTSSWVSLGAHLAPSNSDRIEVSAGADIALSGLPKADGAMAGTPRWQVFARVALRANPSADEARVAQAKAATCNATPDCPADKQCVDGTCVVVKETVKEVIKEVVQAPVSTTFVIQGAVKDLTSNTPVTSAVVTLSGFDETFLAVDAKTGAFKSWPIPTGTGLVKATVRASGYRPFEGTFARGKPDEVVALNPRIQKTSEVAMGEISGTLRDAITGAPLSAGQIFIPALGKKIKADSEGRFSTKVKAGRYQMLISSKKYVTQQKEVEIRVGETVIFNLDMTPN